MVRPSVLSRTVTRWRLPVLDLVLGAVLLISGIGAVLTQQVREGPTVLTVPVAVLGAVAVACRKRWPLPGVVVVALSGITQAIWGAHSPQTLMALVVTLAVTYSVAAECREAAAAVGLVVMLGAQVVQEWLDHGTDYPFLVLEVGGVWLIGRATRSWRSRARRAEEHQRELARSAVDDERARIARELHDVVAHGLSVIAVQASAAEAALIKDPDRATEPLRAIQLSARESLADMRQLLHLLRAEPADGDDRRPARGVADLPQLVSGLRDAGLVVQTRIDLPETVSAGTELAVYRIVQEGLTNVLKHAAAVSCDLVVEHDARVITVTVRNRPGTRAWDAADAPFSTGHGLTGIRERVLAAGGRLRCGPTDDGGFELVAVLPLSQTAGTPS